MKIKTSLFAILAVLLAGVQTVQSQVPETVPGEYIVKLNKEGVRALGAGVLDEDDMESLLVSALGFQEQEKLAPQTFLVKTDPNLPAPMQTAGETVEYIEPNFVYRAFAIPNDTSFSSLWGLRNTGQSGGLNGFDIDVLEVWDTLTGSDNMVVGVIDTGVDYAHPDLAANIWTNPGEIAENGVDDDANGVIDDVHGYNAITGSGDPMDDYNHGTHCAGTIAGVGNNNTGVTGVMWQAKILPLKFLNSQGSGYTSDAVKAVNYAVALKKKGVNIRVLSNSWGGGGFSQALSDAIQAANDEGIVFVAAAGNSASNNDFVPAYPASYRLDNVIAVAAVDRNGRLASFSNYGGQSVHVAAPGVEILSTVRNGGYASMSGTSMATPHVSGVAGLILCSRSELTPIEMRELLVQSSRLSPILDTKTVSNGSVDAFAALTGTFTLPPRLPDIADQGLYQANGPVTIELAVSDPAALPLTISAASSRPDKIVVTLQGNLLTLTPAPQFLGQAVITVSVSNGVRTSTDTFTVIVHNNRPPSILAIGDKTMRKEGTLYLYPSMSDPDGDSLTVSASVAPASAGQVYGSTTFVYFRAAEGFLGTVQVRLQATDGYSTVSRTFSVLVRENSAPVLDAIADQHMSENSDSLFIPLNVVDADNDYLTVTTQLSPPESGVITGYSNYLYFRPAHEFTGNAAVVVTASDGQASASRSFVIEVLPDAAPVIHDIPRQLMRSGTTSAFYYSWSDSDSLHASMGFSVRPLLWKSEGSNVERPIISVTAYSVSITAAAGAEGVLVGELTVSDGKAAASKQFTVVVRDGGSSGMDRDADGVSDVQEQSDGTDPDDRGSCAQELGATVCSEWNGFLGMWNVLELINRSVQPIELSAALYDTAGNERSRVHLTLAPSRQQDLIVHDMTGWERNSYGKVCVRVLSGAGSLLDGRMVYYRPSPKGGFQFAFALPFENGIRGKQYVTFNTFQPSFNPADAQNLRANWIQLTNLELVEQSGVLTFFGFDGAELARLDVRLPAGARSDFSAHALGNDLVGLVEWSPSDDTGKSQLRNIRYFYDNPHGMDSFAAAFQLQGAAGSGSLLAAPFDTRNATSVVEISNVSDRKTTATVAIHGMYGELVQSMRVPLEAHASVHLILDSIVSSGSGTVEVKGDARASMIATVMQYGRKGDGGLKYLYGIQAREAVGALMQTSYNSFLRQGCTLTLVNSKAEAVAASVAMARTNGAYVYGWDNLLVPGHGAVELNLCEHAPADSYGVVNVYSEQTNSISAFLLRKGENDSYRFPTPVND